MAEIHVQARKHSSGSAWIWILIVLLIIASLVYYVVTRHRVTEKNMLRQPDAAATDFKPQVPPAVRERPRQKIQIVYMRTV